MKTITQLIKICASICAFIFIVELSVLFIADCLDKPVQEIKVNILWSALFYLLIQRYFSKEK